MLLGCPDRCATIPDHGDTDWRNRAGHLDGRHQLKNPQSTVQPVQPDPEGLGLHFPVLDPGPVQVLVILVREVSIM